MAKDPYKQFKLPWRHVDGHVVNAKGMNGGAVAFNVGSETAKFIAEAVNGYEHYKSWADHLNEAPSGECRDDAQELFILGEKMKPFIDAWKEKVAELEDALFRAEHAFPTAAEFDNLQGENEALKLENDELTDRLNEALNKELNESA